MQQCSVACIADPRGASIGCQTSERSAAPVTQRWLEVWAAQDGRPRSSSRVVICKWIQRIYMVYLF